MRHFAAVPFTLKRSSDQWLADSFTWTTETAHGLVRLEGDKLVIQWRLAIKTESMGDSEWTVEEDLEPVREIVIPLADVAGASVRNQWWRIFTGPRLVITAADLLSFESVTGEEGLKLSHPAKLELRIRRADRLDAEEFAAELSLAVAQLPRGAEGDALPSAESEQQALEAGSEADSESSD